LGRRPIDRHGYAERGQMPAQQRVLRVFSPIINRSPASPRVVVTAPRVWTIVTAEPNNCPTMRQWGDYGHVAVFATTTT
jgi:hypothetical protein